MCLSNNNGFYFIVIQMSHCMTSLGFSPQEINGKKKFFHTFELSLISTHKTMNSLILGSDDHRGSSPFHHRIEELFCFVQFYRILCDRFSISIYFLIKRVISWALALVWVVLGRKKQNQQGVKWTIFEISFSLYCVEH